MRRFRRSLLLASFLVAAPLTLIASQPASAQVSVNIGFNSFHGQLAGYGDWLYSDRWGQVWRPGTQDRDRGWRPYWAGRWVDTDRYGWTWISDEGPWGDIAYHYGRWVFDPDDGWLWIPGYVWSPAWVVWRSSGQNVGWMPMPPDDGFLGRGGISIGVSFGNWNDIGGYYGYSRWYGSRFDQDRFGDLWTFVPGQRLGDRSFRRYALERPQTINIVRQSNNITNYTVVNNTIINRSVNVDMVRGTGGRAPQPVRADTVLRNNRWVAPVNQGEQIQARTRQENPHGNGLVNSAPPPTPQQIQTLSNRPIPVRTESNVAGAAPGNTPDNNRGGNRHLFNRDNAAQLATRANNQPNAQPNAAEPNAAQPNRPNEPDRNMRGNTPNAPPATPQAQQPPQPGGNDNDRARRNSGRPDNSPTDNRGPQAQPAPTTPPERNRAIERPQQPVQTPAAQAPATPTPAAPPTPPPTEQRGQGRDQNRGPDRNQDRGAERGPAAIAPQPQATPERTPPPRPETPREQRAPAMEQRPQATPERQAAPERQTPERQMPQRQAPERQAAPERPAPQLQAQPPRPQEAARPNPPPDRGADRSERRGNDDRGQPNRGSDKDKDK